MNNSNLSSKNFLNKFHNTGWQSWSTETESKAHFKFPVWNFPPKGTGITLSSIKISKKRKKPINGWCSWYSYGPNISQDIILSQAKWISTNNNLPLKYILVDDGWCLWGDWLMTDKNKFPHGLKKLGKQVKKFGFFTGIWIAPFLADPKSSIVLNHPDWFVKQNGMYVDGYKLTPWDRFFFYKKWILDIKKKEVQNYLDHVLEWLVEESGFNLLKLDFLYGIYFDPDLSRKEADEFLRRFLKKIQSKYPQVYTIACGCPLIPAVNAVDSMRIGPDTIISPCLSFLPYATILNKYFHTDVVKTIRKRIWTKKYWNLDPDAFVCANSSGLREEQIIEFRKTIHKCEGNIFLGDDLTILPKEKINRHILPLFDNR